MIRPGSEFCLLTGTFFRLSSAYKMVYSEGLIVFHKKIHKKEWFHLLNKSSNLSLNGTIASKHGFSWLTFVYLFTGLA